MMERWHDTQRTTGRVWCHGIVIAMITFAFWLFVLIAIGCASPQMPTDIEARQCPVTEMESSGIYTGDFVTATRRVRTARGLYHHEIVLVQMGTHARQSFTLAFTPEALRALE